MTSVCMQERESMHGFKDLQKIRKKIKTPRLTDEGWNSQKQSGPVEQKKKEKTLVSSSKALPRSSSL